MTICSSSGNCNETLDLILLLPESWNETKPHTTGSVRSEGYYKINPSDKKSYLEGVCQGMRHEKEVITLFNVILIYCNVV